MITWQEVMIHFGGTMENNEELQSKQPDPGWDSNQILIT
jgi:hypothetical protein